MKNKKATVAVSSAPARRPVTQHIYFEECQLTNTSKNIKDKKILALELNRLIHAAIAQDATFVDLQWDEKNKWFTVFATRTRQVA